MKRAILILLLGATVAYAGLDQWFARNVGGTATIDLEPNQKLMTVAWKDHDLWYLVRPMRSDEKPEEYQLIESSLYGLMSGKVIIKEKK